MKKYTLLGLSFLFCILPAQAEEFADTLAAYTASGSDDRSFGCFFCPLFSALFDAMNNLATNVATKMADLFLLVLGIGLLFMIAFKVGRVVISMQEVDVMQFLGDLFKSLGRGLIAATLLVYSTSIFYYLVSPVIQLSLSLSNAIYAEAGTKELTIVKIARSSGVDMTVKCQVSNQSSQTSDQEMAFSPNVKEALLCNLQQVSASLVVGMIIGVIIFIVSFALGVFGVIPNPLIMAAGSFLLLFFVGLLCTYSLKLLDALFRIAVVAALMPLWVIFWVFPPTAKFTQRAWTMLLSACFLFIGLSVAMAFIMIALDTSAFSDAFITALQDGKIAEAVSLLTVSFLVLLGVLFLCTPMLGAFETLANSISGGAALGVGAGLTRISTIASQFVVSTASTALKAKNAFKKPASNKNTSSGKSAPSPKAPTAVLSTFNPSAKASDQKTQQPKPFKTGFGKKQKKRRQKR